MSNRTEIAVTIEDETWRDDLPNVEEICHRAVVAALRGVVRRFAGTMEISVVLTDDATMQALNYRYRGKDSSTNVLSFPSDDPRLGLTATEALPNSPTGTCLLEEMPLLLGDVVVAHETLCRESRAEGKPLDGHFCHLVVHGTLHLLGFDHTVALEAETMERLEASILLGLGIPDPYDSSNLSQHER